MNEERSNNNSLKYGVDQNPNSNCFFLHSKNLSITWGEDNRYWRWSKIEETSDKVVDVAELLEVCWLEVRGELETRKLSPGTRYEVAFVIMMKEAATGWEAPVNVRLILPDGNKQEGKENLMKKPRGEWIEIPVGEFVASPEKSEEMKFSIYEHGGHWKRGLVVKGIAIRPKY
ncbi:lectin-like [Alnus glutinosa]|uniref:lectin-like n=1 Tax=Alnus glutinosa TaxID=3517 RepID=UPI002D76A366|nr:lectin-like [Alnus glutinosa]